MAEADAFLVVGLGNPGTAYEWTPHNLGFQVVDELAKRCNVRIKLREGQALTARARLDGQAVWLAQPQTFMNLSGDAVVQLLAKGDLAGLLIIYDDFDLPFGTLRLKEHGSAGSHNGMRSIVARLGPEVPRMRLGIAPPHPVGDLKRYVLTPWSAAARANVEQMVAKAADAAALVMSGGMARAMNRYNTPEV